MEKKYTTFYYALSTEAQPGRRYKWLLAILDGERRILLRQLIKKFGNIQALFRQKIEQANQKELMLWSEKLLFSNSLEEVFDTPNCIKEFDEDENWYHINEMPFEENNEPISLSPPKEVITSLIDYFSFPDERVFAQVATQSNQGPHIRTMRLYDITEEGGLIFLSRTDTLKWRDLQENAKISVCFLNSHKIQLLAEGVARLITTQENIPLIKHHWKNLPLEIKKIYSDQEMLDKISVYFGLIIIYPAQWEILKLKKDYTCSERYRFYLKNSAWKKQEIDITS